MITYLKKLFRRDVKSVGDRISSSIVFAVFVSTVVFGIYHYVSVINMNESEISIRSQLSLKLIKGESEKGIDGVNQMILADSLAYLAKENPDLIYSKIIGTSAGSPKTDFFDAIPPKEVESLHVDKAWKESPLFQSLQEMEIEAFPESQFEYWKGLYFTKIPLDIKNKGYILSVFKAEKLKFLWLWSLLEVLLITAPILLICTIIGRKQARKIEDQFIDRDELQSISAKLRNASKTVNEFAGTVSAHSNDLFSSFEESTRSLGQMEQLIEGVSSTIKENLEKVQHSFDVTKDILRASEEGTEGMSELLMAMKSIEESNDNIKQVTDMIDNINDKSKSIENITFQTKLLSFNASVEAARAGDYGKGFSVVAEEMNSLAQLTSQSSSEISNIVDQSKKAAEDIILVNSHKVKNGSEISELASEKLANIVKHTKESMQQGEEVLNSSEKQASDFEELNNMMRRIEEIYKENQGQITQTINLGKELHEHSEEIDTYVDDLYGLLELRESA